MQHVHGHMNYQYVGQHTSHITCMLSNTHRTSQDSNPVILKTGEVSTPMDSASLISNYSICTCSYSHIVTCTCMYIATYIMYVHIINCSLIKLYIICSAQIM